MIGIHRRKRIEGWALDLNELEVSGPHYSLRQKLGEDNRLWLIVAGAIVVLTFWIIMGLQGKDNEDVAKEARVMSTNMNYTDQAHRDFTNEFLKNKRYCKSVIEGGFTSPGIFRLVMPSDASADDIDFTSKMAAKLIENKLNERVAVYTYFKKVATGEEWRTAITQWDATKQSYSMKMLVESGSNL